MSFLMSLFFLILLGCFVYIMYQTVVDIIDEVKRIRARFTRKSTKTPETSRLKTLG